MFHGLIHYHVARLSMHTVLGNPREVWGALHADLVRKRGSKLSMMP